MPLNLPYEVWSMLVGAGVLFLGALIFIVVMRSIVNRGR